MKIALVIIALVFIGVLMWAVIKSRRHTESGTSTYEHPGTYKKPDIEMVNKRPPAAGSNSTNLNVADDNNDA